MDNLKNLYASFGNTLATESQGEQDVTVDLQDAQTSTNDDKVKFVDAHSATPHACFALENKGKVKFIRKESFVYVFTVFFKKISSCRLYRFITSKQQSNYTINIGDFIWIKLKDKQICRVLDYEKGLVDPSVENDSNNDRLLVKKYKKYADGSLVPTKDRDFWVSASSYVEHAKVKRNNVNDDNRLYLDQ